MLRRGRHEQRNGRYEQRRVQYEKRREQYWKFEEQYRGSSSVMRIASATKETQEDGGRRRSWLGWRR